MPKLKLADLETIREKVRRSTLAREGSKCRAKVIVHMETCGIAAGARKILATLSKEIEASNLNDVFVMTSGCAGMCNKEPMLTVELPGKPPVKYIKLDEAKTKRIFKEHILGGNIVKEYALAVGSVSTG